jgi:hypothetical protein
MTAFHAFITGGATMAFLAAAAFFARFWKETHDRLFLLFAVAFAALALNRTLIVFYPVGRESQPYVYLVRLFAFVLIAYAVVDKNRTDKG